MTNETTNTEMNVKIILRGINFVIENKMNSQKLADLRVAIRGGNSRVSGDVFSVENPDGSQIVLAVPEIVAVVATPAS